MYILPVWVKPNEGYYAIEPHKSCAAATDGDLHVTAQGRHEATPTAAILGPPESASGAPGARVVPLVQLFDMKHYNATNPARIAANANPGGLAAEQRKSLAAHNAEQGDWITKEALWKDGYKEKLDYVDWRRDDVSSHACSSRWDDDWWTVTHRQVRRRYDVPQRRRRRLREAERTAEVRPVEALGLAGKLCLEAGPSDEASS